MIFVSFAGVLAIVKKRDLGGVHVAIGQKANLSRHRG